MSEFRSAAETFVTQFLNHVQYEDILDEFDTRTQKMVRSEKISALIKQAESVFPPRVADGQVENEKLAEEDVLELADPNVVVLETREMFGKRIAANGSARGLLERVLAGDEEAVRLGREFVAAETGEKEFHVPVKA